MYYNKYVGKCFLLLLSVTVLAIYPGSGAVCAEAEERESAGQVTSAGQVISADQPNLPYSMVPGWNQSGEDWYWMDPDRTLHKGWLQADGRTYYLDENGAMVRGWREVDGEWYYFHEDGGMNLGELVLDNGVYGFSKGGALESAQWVEEHMMQAVMTRKPSHFLMT